MKVLITSLNPKHDVNPVVNRLFTPLAKEFAPAKSIHEAEAVFLSFIAAPQELTLDRELLWEITQRNMPVVVFDHTESLGQNYLLTQGEPPRDFGDYQILHDAVLRVRAYFKRELLTAAWSPLPFPVYPLDWTVPEFGSLAPDTREQFNARPIDLLMSWGYSSLSRPRMYGELIRQAERFGAHFALQPEDVTRALAEKRERIFALLFAPYYRRIPMSDILKWQKQTKVTLSLKGMGLKCFRCAEASFNSILAQQSPEAVQWSYPWVPGQNCIGLPNRQGEDDLDEGAALELLWSWLRIVQGDLYDIYLRGIENQKHYRMEPYARNYLLPKLREALK